MSGRALLLEDGASRAALAAVRSLGRAGWEVGVGAPVRSHAASSRWCAARHHVAGAELEPDAFVADAVAASAAYDLVFPCGDAETLLLSANRERLGAWFPYPPDDAVVRTFDKLDLVQVAGAVGVDVPATRLATPQLEKAVELPVVVKARTRHVTRGHVPYAILAADRAVLSARAAAIRSVGAEPLLQQHVVGALAALTVLLAPDGGLVAQAYQLADETWPPGMGGSVRAHTADPPPGLVAGAVRLLGELGWFGLAQIQFMRSDDGDHRLIDVNGRLYGSIALAIAAGVDFPRLWADGAASPAEPLAARSGIRYHALDGDLRRLLAERRLTLDFIPYGARAAHALWRRDDPLPAVLNATALGRSAARKLACGVKR